MIYKINPFSFVAKQNDKYYFQSRNLSENKVFAFSQIQEEYFSKLINGDEIEYNELCRVYTAEQMDYFIDNNIFCSETPLTDGIFSRTDAFFNEFGMHDTRAHLNEKHVLILGCGGIGTHIAWHMTSLGVGKITLLDFDVVEESNLNRQILFDMDCVGEKKVCVLKERLLKVNPNIKINVIDKLIDSFETLETVCLCDDFDLIIKSLDSPEKVALWLDTVCKKNKIPYVTGVTLRNEVLIGPTFIPDKSEIGWSDLINLNQSAKKINGIAPSLGIMLCYAAEEIAIEAFKILTSKGKLKYCGRISFYNVFDNTEHSISETSDSSKEDDLKLSAQSPKGIVVGLLLIIALSVGGFFNSISIILAFFVSLILPFYLYSKKEDILKCTFIFAMIFAFVTGLVIINNDILYEYFGNRIQLVSVLLLVCGISCCLILIMCAVNFIVAKMKNKQKTN